MPHINLTKTDSIATESVEMVRLIEHNGQPGVELWHKRSDLSPSYFWGDEAAEAWANWKAYMQRVEDERRGAADAHRYEDRVTKEI